MADAAKRRREVANAPNKVKEAVLLTKFGKVQTAKLLDRHYKMALTIGVEQLITSGILVYDNIKEG